MTRILAAALLSLFACNAWSQDIREATAEEFVGFWKLVPIANDRQPRTGLPAPLFQGACQYFIHLDNGDWFHADIQNMAGEAATRAQCNLTKNDLKARMHGVGKSTFGWQKHGRAFATINRQSKIAHVWKVDLVRKDMATAAKLGFDLKQGDLIMQVLNKELTAVVWQLVLRPVAD